MPCLLLSHSSRYFAAVVAVASSASSVDWLKYDDMVAPLSAPVILPLALKLMGVHDVVSELFHEAAKSLYLLHGPGPAAGSPVTCGLPAGFALEWPSPNLSHLRLGLNQNPTKMHLLSKVLGAFIWLDISGRKGVGKSAQSWGAHSPYLTG